MSLSKIKREKQIIVDGTKFHIKKLTFSEFKNIQDELDKKFPEDKMTNDHILRTAEVQNKTKELEAIIENGDRAPTESELKGLTAIANENRKLQEVVVERLFYEAYLFFKAALKEFGEDDTVETIKDNLSGDDVTSILSSIKEYSAGKKT